MKKLLLTVIILLVTVLTAYSQTGIIRELTGDVELKPASSSVFIPAQEGNEIAMDTIVSTGFRSTAVIAIGSSLITVRPLTRLSLSEIHSSSGIENMHINLQAGRIKVDVKPPAGTKANAVVQSPSATASVRGTIFEMDVLNLNVIEGNVLLYGKDGLGVNVAGGTSAVILEESSKNTGWNIAPDGPVGNNLSGGSSSGSVGELANSKDKDGEVSFVVSWK